jgi:hypothetical protein
MSETFVGVIVFHCRLDYCHQRNLTHQYPWAKANMAIDVRNIYWGDCFALSIGILSPTEFRSPADLSRGFIRFIAGYFCRQRNLIAPWIYPGVIMDLSTGKCKIQRTQTKTLV